MPGGARTVIRARPLAVGLIPTYVWTTAGLPKGTR
jgi:hypothetical protein